MPCGMFTVGTDKCREALTSLSCLAHSTTSLAEVKLFLPCGDAAFIPLLSTTPDARPPHVALLLAEVIG